jgi:biotin operon repressor
MFFSVAKAVERLRKAGFEISPVHNTCLWYVSGRGRLNAGQLIDLSSQLVEH